MHLIFVGFVLTCVFGLLIAFKPDAWVWAVAILWCFLFGILNYTGNAVDKTRIINGLRARDNAFFYTKMVSAIRDTVARMMSPPVATDDPKPKGRIASFLWYQTPRAIDAADLRKLQRSTWSWPVMDAALKLAVIYPLLLLLLQWGWTGLETGIAGVPILEEEPRVWVRAGLISPLVFYLIVKMLASATQRQIVERAAEWLFWVALAVALALALALAGAVAVAVAFAGALAVELAVALAGAVAFAVGVAGALAVAFAVAVALAFAVAVALAGAVAFAVALAVAFAGVALLGYLIQRNWGRYAYFVFAGILLFTAVVVFALFGANLPAERRFLVFAISLLPLINAIFDYCSYGLTLSLINAGWRNQGVRILGFWVVDVIVAIVLLLGLGITLGMVIGLINHLAAEQLFDLRAIIDGIKNPATRGDYTWLYLCLLSTLVPTLLHTLIMLLSAFTWIPLKYKTVIANWVEGGQADDLDTLRGTFIAATVGAAWAALVAFALVGIYQFFANGFEPFGLWLLDCIEAALLFVGFLQ